MAQHRREQRVEDRLLLLRVGVQDLGVEPLDGQFRVVLQRHDDGVRDGNPQRPLGSDRERCDRLADGRGLARRYDRGARRRRVRVPWALGPGRLKGNAGRVRGRSPVFSTLGPRDRLRPGGPVAHAGGRPQGHEPHQQPAEHASGLSGSTSHVSPPRVLRIAAMNWPPVLAAKRPAATPGPHECPGPRRPTPAALYGAEP